MLYDNDKFKGLPSHVMMTEVNRRIVDDIIILRGTYNYTTKYSSIDEKDMSMILSTTGRIVVASYLNIKEKNIDSVSIDKQIEYLLKDGAHAELQLDRVIKRSGVIANISESMAKSFDDHLTELQEFIGAPVEEFSHVSINEEKNMPNNIFFIGAGLSPINDRIEKINERIAEIESLQDNKDESDDVFTVDVDAANNKRDYKKAKISDTINVSSIFDDFM